VVKHEAVVAAAGRGGDGAVLATVPQDFQQVPQGLFDVRRIYSSSRTLRGGAGVSIRSRRSIGNRS